MFKSLDQINLAFNDMMEAASMVKALGRFDMESMIIGFLTDGQVVPAGDP